MFVEHLNPFSRQAVVPLIFSSTHGKHNIVQYIHIKNAQRGLDNCCAREAVDNEL